MRRLQNIFWLGLKELASLGRDPVMLVLIVYAFTAAVYAVANGLKMGVDNASIAVVDEDHSSLSRSITDAFLPPYFQPAEEIAPRSIDRTMDNGHYTFVVDIPPDFETDVLSGRQPAVQILVDATAMSQAGIGAAYVQEIVSQETRRFVSREDASTSLPVDWVTRARFNPNLEVKWFTAVMQISNSITILSIVLVGAAVIREREHGTLEHLLVMPLSAAEIMLAKVWANALVILIAATVSLNVVVRWWLGVPVAGSIPLFLCGAALYLFATTALGILLATLARSMPQFGLLAIPVFIVMILLSGATTPMESMPEILQALMQALPAAHFVRFAQAVLYRGAGIDLVWPDLLAITGLALVFFSFALYRFRASLAAAG
ncbi:Inner membrane transport permease YhhJ [wastewater metagenome]|uniref:Inner membrane transport permease YhhJ n=2 Tax=unclassified sequences TaxID=12908 RepID=A0A5B8RCE7_9ZZZZ|nr:MULTISPECIES: ABC transporter permease [Arhodomonas]QEA04367.1 inner membrane transport permease YhhJ [uncultured organism]